MNEPRKIKKSVKKASQSPKGIDHKQIEIDFRALIDLLSHHLYRDKSAVIRELLSNSNDSLARKGEFDFENEKPMIRIWLDHEKGRLIVKDNGIGMSKEDLIDYLSTIGASLTKQKSEQYKDDKDSFDVSIGRFGVGFLSSFIVADSIIVNTRKLENLGYQWQSEGERDYIIRELPDLEYGTTIFLDLKSEVSKEWNDDVIKKLVLENARNFVYPIFWGIEGDEKLNDLQAPWYQEVASDEEEYREFLIKYSERFASAENAVEMIPLYSEDIRGVVYFLAGAVLKQEQIGAVDLYCKRVFVCKDHSDIVPEEFRIIKGIVDCFRFKLNLARDDVQQDNSIYRGVREFIGTQILEHFCKLAQQVKTSAEITITKPGTLELNSLRLQTIMDQYHIVIKNALIQKKDEKQFSYEDRFLRDLANFVPFQSSVELTTTIPEYLNRAKMINKDNELLFLYPDANIRAHKSISEQQKREFIVIRHPIEEKYLKRHCQIIGIKYISALDVFSQESFPKLQIPDGWRQIINYYQDQLNHPEFSLSVYLSEFLPEGVAGRLLVDRDSEGIKELQKMISDLQKMIKEYEEKHGSSKENPLHKELEKLKRRSPHSLYLNKDNPVLTNLATMLIKGIDINLDVILHSMFHEITIAAGHQVAELHLTECQTKIYSEILDGISARNEFKDIKKQLRKLEDKYSEAKREIELANAEAASARTELANLQSQDGKQQVTNDVFFIRPIKEGKDPYDYISKKAADICERLKLNFIDPKTINRPGNILEEILDNLKNSKFVIADITEIDNPNIYYEVGYVHGAYPNKLLLIADKDAVKAKLPFDIRMYRALGYNRNSPEEFEEFIVKLEEMIIGLINT